MLNYTSALARAASMGSQRRSVVISFCRSVLSLSIIIVLSCLTEKGGEVAGGLKDAFVTFLNTTFSRGIVNVPK